MRDVLTEIVSVDWEQVRLRRAVSGLIAMLAAFAFLGSIGDAALAALFGALFTTAAGDGGTLRERIPGMVRFAIAGAVLGGLAYGSAESGVIVALVLGIATYLGTLAASGGPAGAKAGIFLTLWPLFALLLGSTDAEPWTAVVGFLAGGAVAIGVTAVRLSVAGSDDVAEEPAEATDTVTGESLAHRFVAAARSPIGVFAVLRSVAVVLAVLAGFWIVPDFPLWVAITVIVVVKPSANQSLSTAVQRVVGTAVGVAIGVAVASVLPQGDTAVGIAFLLSGVLMVAFNNANYTLFATFLTAMLVFGQRLVQADAFEAGWERLLATVIGAAIGVAVMALASTLSSREPDGRSSTGV